MLAYLRVPLDDCCNHPHSRAMNPIGNGGRVLGQVRGFGAIVGALPASFATKTRTTSRFERMQPKTSHDFLRIAEQRLNAAEALFAADLTLDAQYVGGYALKPEASFGLAS